MNQVIPNSETADKILLPLFRTARGIPDNSSRLYQIDGGLSSFQRNYSLKKPWVWAVKTGANTFCGLFCCSGIIPDGETEISSGVFVSFHDNDIMNEEGENLNQREIRAGVHIRYDAEGNEYLEELAMFPDNFSAAEALRRNHPNLKGGVIMAKVGDPGQRKSYWIIADGKNDYRGISPFGGEEICFSRNVPITIVNLNEYVGRGFGLYLRSGKFVLIRQKATKR